LKYERAAARSGPSRMARDLCRGSIERPPECGAMREMGGF